MGSLPLSDLRPGVVVPAGAWTTRGVLVEPYIGGQPHVKAYRSGLNVDPATAVALSLSEPGIGAWIDGCDVLAGMLARASSYDTVGGVWWGASAGDIWIQTQRSTRIWKGDTSDPRAALVRAALAWGEAVARGGYADPEHDALVDAIGAARAAGVTE